MARVLVISFSDLAQDPRVDRQLRHLAREFDVVAAGTGPPARESDFVRLNPLFRGRRDRLRFQAQLGLRTHERTYWSQGAVRAAREALAPVDADAVVANDLESLPLALSLGAPVLFDAHEFSPSEFEDSLRWRLTWRPYVRYLCAKYIPQAAGMSSVSDGIAARYERETGVRCVVVRNASDYVDLEPSPGGDEIRLVHHGGADASRRLETMIEAMAHLDERFSLDLVLVGGRSYRRRLERLARGNPRIRFHGPVPMGDLIGFANAYDVGLYPLDPGAFNRLHALPNKFFEFIQARLAIVIGPSPEMARIVRDRDLGLVADDFSAASIAKALTSLDRSRITTFKRNSHVAASELSAEREMATFNALVRDLLAAAD